MKPSLKKGFSLIELIFVIVVVGIIAAVAVPKLLDSRNSAIVTTIQQDIKTITNAVQSYAMLNNSITNISDAVNINTSTWNVSDKEVFFPESATSTDDACVSISIVDNKTLEIKINKDVSSICEKIHEAGISDDNYTLF